MRIAIIIILIALVSCSFLPYKLVEHKVASGDTLLYIAETYKADIGEIVRLNKITDTTKLDYGSSLLIRVAKNNNNQLQKITKKQDKTNATKDKNVETNATEYTAAKNTKDWHWPVAITSDILAVDTVLVADLLEPQLQINIKKNNYVVASNKGVVTYTGTALKEYGKLIVIAHNNNYISAYGNLNDTYVTKGDNIAKGQKIANISKANFLIFELRKNGIAIDALRLLPNLAN